MAFELNIQQVEVLQKLKDVLTEAEAVMLSDRLDEHPFKKGIIRDATKLVDEINIHCRIPVMSNIQDLPEVLVKDETRLPDRCFGYAGTLTEERKEERRLYGGNLAGKLTRSPANTRIGALKLCKAKDLCDCKDQHTDECKESWVARLSKMQALFPKSVLFLVYGSPSEEGSFSVGAYTKLRIDSPPGFSAFSTFDPYDDDGKTIIDLGKALTDLVEERRSMALTPVVLDPSIPDLNW